ILSKSILSGRCPSFSFVCSVRMVKDRLPELLAKHNGYHMEERKRKCEETTFDTAFFEKVSFLSKTLDELKDHVSEVERIHRDILASPQNTPNLETRLEKLTKLIREKAFTVRAELKGVEETPSDKSTLLSSTRERIRTAQHAAITRQLIDIMSLYNRYQLDFRDKCKSSIRGKLIVVVDSGFCVILCQLRRYIFLTLSFCVVRLPCHFKPAMFIFAQIMACTDAAKRSLSDIEARHADIIRLEKSIEELHDLFLTMALTVDSQVRFIRISILLTMHCIRVNC
ncbi:syntaxin 1A, partial [Paragonimus westermani]